MTDPVRATREVRGARPTAASPYVVGAYAALALLLPFIIDSGLPAVGVFVLWVGGSFLVGALDSSGVTMAIPGLAFIVFVVIMLLGTVDTEFFSDPLSSVALAVLAGGQYAGLIAGRKSARLLSRRH